MKGTIMKCRSCKKYTLLKACPACGKETSIPGPVKYSTTDRFQAFRIKELEDENIG